MSKEAGDWPEGFPVEYTDEEYSRAFLDFLEGVVLSDIAQVISSAEIITERPSPFAKGAAFDARMIEKALFETSPVKTKQSEIDVASENIIRAYVYSGLNIDPDMVHVFTSAIGKDKKWLKGLIKPTDTLITDVIGATTQAEKVNYRYMGYKAMLDLGVASPYMKLLYMKFF